MGREVEWWEKRVVGGKSPDDEDPRDLRRAAQRDETIQIRTPVARQSDAIARRPATRAGR